jgi:hypothetical protein
MDICDGIFAESRPVEGWGNCIERLSGAEVAEGVVKIVEDHTAEGKVCWDD